MFQMPISRCVLLLIVFALVAAGKELSAQTLKGRSSLRSLNHVAWTTEVVTVSRTGDSLVLGSRKEPGNGEGEHVEYRQTVTSGGTRKSFVMRPFR